ncbi:MAG: KamA family radical SAM protein [Deltaproteobacteria bacterium]|nr:KamA family radical SAM protein [Deltaproteobacteria bacterium]
MLRTRPTSPRSPRRLFGASVDEWRDWRWQERHVVHGAQALAAHLALSEDEREGITRASFPASATPYYLSLADRDDPWCPVRRQIVPSTAETRRGRGELADPLGEDRDMPVPGLVHRYPDRVLFLATSRCSAYCRHCTRRRRTGAPGASAGALERAAAYVRAHREVRDVLVSGGDPLLLPTAHLTRVLRAFRSIPHVEILRVGTRMPVTNPFRVTGELVAALRRLAPLFVITHFNHPKEVTAQARAACEALVDGGIPVENQTVLLRRLNSSSRILGDLFRRLLTMRVRPYYLHQMDVAQGLEHLRTPLEEGVAILAALRGTISGLAIPHLAVDLPGGGGKVTLQPDYLVSLDARQAVLRNGRGKTYRYPQPVERDCSCPYESTFYGSSEVR